MKTMMILLSALSAMTFAGQAISNAPIGEFKIIEIGVDGARGLISVKKVGTSSAQQLPSECSSNITNARFYIELNSDIGRATYATALSAYSGGSASVNRIDYTLESNPDNTKSCKLDLLILN